MNRQAYPASQSQVTIRRFTAFVFCASLALAASRAAAQSPEPAESNAAPQPRRRIVVSIPDRKLALLENDRVVKVYEVAVGAPVSPSPNGEYVIARRLENPTYFHPGVVISPGTNNPLGPRWIGLNVKGFGIHGTNRPESIGKNASHGCIRLRNRDIQELFQQVQVGDTVSLIAERNEKVARLFAPTPENSLPTQTVVAKNEAATGADDDTQGER